MTTRRQFLARALRTSTASAVPVLLGGMFLPTLPANESTSSLEPEHASDLKRVFFVYGQIASPYQFPEITEICGHLPPDAEVFVLASDDESDVARDRFAKYGIHAQIVKTSTEASWHWGRDVCQLGCPGNVRTLLVPWNKTAGPGDDLVHNARTLKSLRSLGIRLQQAPLSFEVGNCIFDRVDDKTVLFVGHTALLETMALYDAWLAKTLSFDEARSLFQRTFGVDRVIPLGRNADGQHLPQASSVFHIDMVVSVPVAGVAVVQTFDVSTLSEQAVYEDVLAEIEASIGDAAGREAIEALIKEREITCKVPVTAGERETHARNVARTELEALREASTECDVIAATLKSLGYQVHRIENEWQRVRRHQALSNVVPSHDRLLVPLFPATEKLFAYTLPLPSGRRIATLRATPGRQEYRTDGVNRRSFELYSKLAPNVRMVRDRFYLTGGNLHCVVGRL